MRRRRAITGQPIAAAGLDFLLGLCRQNRPMTDIEIGVMERLIEMPIRTSR
jgi:hypothetical protein